jgi:hypothetical protein
VKALWGVRGVEMVAGDGSGDQVIDAELQRVGHRQDGQRSLGPIESGDHSCDKGPGNEGARRVVDEDTVGRVLCKSLQAEPHRVLPGIAA